MSTRSRITCLLTLVAFAAPLAVGCGGDDDETAVRETMNRFAQATAAKDYQRLCDELLDPQLLEALRTRNLPCEVALQTGLEDVEQPSLSVKSVKVDGRRATAVVRTTAANQPPSEDRVELLKRDGTWRIASLSS